MNIIHEIDLYVKYLKESLGLWITLHPFGDEYLISGSDLIKYNIHQVPYCLYIKSSPELLRICVEKQDLIHKKLLKTPIFTGVCHAGVKERVYGLFCHGKYLGFISVSGYKADQKTALLKIGDISSGSFFERDNLICEYDRLSSTFPDESFLDTIILPLCRMIEYGNLYLEQSRLDTESLYIRILRYINRNFCTDISTQSLADLFGVSRSQISHTFKKHRGVSISEYVISLRLELAESLLSGTSENITDIAYSVGFSDCCYFSNVFKKKYQVTPSAFRKSTNISKTD